MFRPLRLVGRNAVQIVSVVSQRSKVIFTESFLDKAERMKLWNTENKKLFGPLTKEKKASQKDKRKRVTKSAKQSKNESAAAIIASPQNSGNETKTKKTQTKLTNEELMFPIEKKILLTNAINMLTTDESPFIKSINISSSPDKMQQVERFSPIIKTGMLSLASNTSVPSIIIRNLRLFPMMSNQKAYIADKSSDESPEEKILQVRSSKMEHQKFPSVTKILEQTLSPESKEALDKWKNEKIAELGLIEFEKFYKAQLESGSKFHEQISKHLLNSQDTLSVDKEIQGVWSSVAHVLKNIKSPKAIESHVVHPVLKYKGVVDCIAVYQDKPMLIEWKKSDKPKPTLAATYDNPIQLAAYFGAISHDPNYKALNVRDALLVIAYTDGSPADCFHLSMDQMRQHWAAWLTRLEKFMAAEKPAEKNE